MSDSPQRATLLSAKLRALAGDRGVVVEQLVFGDFGLGCAAMAGNQAWVLLDRDAAQGLGPALIWALRRHAAELHLLADGCTGLLARRAQAFSLPTTVWLVEGRALIEALPVEIDQPAAVPAEHFQFESTIVAAGATPVVEHGVLSGEVEGLEVCRVITADTGEARLEVGVGAHDRETFQLLHANRPQVEALAEVVSTVAAVRRPGAPAHPLNRLAAERRLRAAILRQPSLVGASNVVAMQPPFPRPNVKDAVACAAVADIDGTDTLVVCSAGVDLDVVPFATDARLASGIRPCLVALPARDLLPAQQLLADHLVEPVRFVTVDPNSSPDSTPNP
jgi:hypothetical protein